MMNKTAINLQEKQRQPIIVGRKNTGVQNWVFLCVWDIEITEHHECNSEVGDGATQNWKVGL